MNQNPIEQKQAGPASVKGGNAGAARASARVLRMRPCALRRVWAVAETAPVAKATAANEAGLKVVRGRCRGGEPAAAVAPKAVARPAKPAAEFAFYRQQTQALLRRYMRLSVQAGRVPSLLGRELFQGNVSHHQASSFEEVVLFCIDVERCLARLNPAEKALISRVALQQYTQGEAAALLGVALRTVVRGYAAALDRVSEMLVKGRILGSLESCQEGRPVEKRGSR